MIREAVAADAGELARIYNYYIEKTVVTFETEVITTGEMNKRIKNVQSSGHNWLVAQENGTVVGYAYATKWRERAAYQHTVEVSVYLDSSAVARGWGTKLYSALFSELRKKSVHTAIGGIALPNPASVAVHEKFGMEKVAHFKEVGCKLGQWIDVGYWQVHPSELTHPKT